MIFSPNVLFAERTAEVCQAHALIVQNPETLSYRSGYCATNVLNMIKSLPYETANLEVVLVIGIERRPFPGGPKRLIRVLRPKRPLVPLAPSEFWKFHALLQIRRGPHTHILDPDFAYHMGANTQQMKPISPTEYFRAMFESPRHGQTMDNLLIKTIPARIFQERVDAVTVASLSPERLQQLFHDFSTAAVSSIFGH